MMDWWYADDALMMHWWFTEDVLMMQWWCTGDTQYNFLNPWVPFFFKNIAYCNGQLEGWVSNLLFYIISFSLFEVVYSRTFSGAVFFLVENLGLLCFCQKFSFYLQIYDICPFLEFRRKFLSNLQAMNIPWPKSTFFVHKISLLGQTYVWVERLSNLFLESNPARKSKREVTSREIN